MTVYKPEIRFKNVVSILNVRKGGMGDRELANCFSILTLAVHCSVFNK
jgi:hypothetical protein